MADGPDGPDFDALLNRPLSRRQFLARGALVLSVPALAGIVPRRLRQQLAELGCVGVGLCAPPSQSARP